MTTHHEPTGSPKPPAPSDDGARCDWCGTPLCTRCGDCPSCSSYDDQDPPVTVCECGLCDCGASHEYACVCDNTTTAPESTDTPADNTPAPTPPAGPPAPEDGPGPGRRWTWRLVLTPAVIAAVIFLRALAGSLINPPDPAPDTGAFSQTVHITTATGQPRTCAVTDQDTQTITLACPLHP